MVVYCENQTEHENEIVEKQLETLMLRLVIQYPLGYKWLKGIRRKYLIENVQCNLVYILTDLTFFSVDSTL
jgi:hypothetical protein